MKIGLAILASLLLLAAPAAAECGWVLWSLTLNIRNAEQETWAPTSAFPDFEGCTEQLAEDRDTLYSALQGFWGLRENEQLFKYDNKVGIVNNALVMEGVTQGINPQAYPIQVWWRCLPSTIDPRN